MRKTALIDPATLPPFSGPCPPCRKCGLPEGKAVGTTVAYRQTDDGREYVDRRCGHCGYVWPERCADADGPVCDTCGGWVESGKSCVACAGRKWFLGISTLSGGKADA